MISPVVSEGFLFICTPRGCSALVRVLETNNVVDVDEVTGFVGVEACGDVGFIAMVVEVFAIVTLCNDN
tara:strand:- start:1480 stop:1686 length:207 start_codon:yes stop_codon:yes gene_type:complete